MEFCIAGAKIFSTCGKRRYMAVLLDGRHRVVGVGYNGGPSGMEHCEDGGCPRFLENSPSGSNYDNCIAIHAEQNAFLNCVADPKILFVNGPPCYTCAKLIVNSTVEEVHYVVDPSYKDWERVEKFMKDNGITLCQQVR
jgi:dCMP deaminase